MTISSINIDDRFCKSGATIILVNNGMNLRALDQGLQQHVLPIASSQCHLTLIQILLCIQ